MNLRLISMLALAASLFAQAPGVPPGAPPPPPTDDVQAYLTLTDAQIQALQQLRQTAGQALKPLHDQLDQKQSAMQQQLAAGSTDAAALGRMLLETEAARKQLEQSHKSFHDQAVNLLTPAQKSKLAILQDAAKDDSIPQAGALLLLNPPSSEYAASPASAPAPTRFGPGPSRAPRAGN